MRTAYFVAPWDLNRELACVPERPEDGPVLLVESIAKGRALPWHRQKLVLVLSAMRHFADELAAEGYDVTMLRSAGYTQGMREFADERGIERFVLMEPREWGLRTRLERAAEAELAEIELDYREDGGAGGHFLLRRGEFADWAEGRRTLRMDAFYRNVRERFGWLIEPSGEPTGGSWSFDKENRKSAKGVRPPRQVGFPPDETTSRQIERVRDWPGLWGSVEGFCWPVTRADALEALDAFAQQRLPDFGRYQDAMLAGEDFMWHACLSAAMNLSLLHPREIAERIVLAHENGSAPLASVEGALRQVVGWREFIRGVYWLRMPEMRAADLLCAERPLPDFYWDPTRTDMRCLRECVGNVERNGYAHHIQRLMVLGNFALLAGIRPLDVSHWFWAGFVDAYEWVELPNVHGMALYADDAFTTKPYAASAGYIHRMSDYCKGCRFDHAKRTGKDACPFNHLYWDFLARHRERFEKNPRMRMIYGTWDRFGPEEQGRIREQSRVFLEALRPAPEEWSFDDDAC